MWEIALVTMSRMQRAIDPLYWAVVVLCAGWFAASCGPCAALQSDFDARMRHELKYLAIDDRVETSGPAHGYLHIGPDAFEVVSASALKDEEPYHRTIAVNVPEYIWGYKGQIRIETSIRLDHVDTDFMQAGWGAQNVALDADVLVRARIEVPGKRARWTWYARAMIKTGLRLDEEDGEVIEISLKNASLVDLDPNLPWTEEGMPEEINQIVANGIADAIEAVLLENQDAHFAVMKVRPLNFSSMSFPIRVASAQVDSERRVLSIAFHTALRPTFKGAGGPVSANFDDFGAEGIALQIPRETLDAALRQQSMRGSTPTFVRFGEHEQAQWQALWGEGAFKDNAWRGVWSLWRFETRPCRHRTLETTVRISAEDGVLVIARDPVPSEAFGETALGRGGPEALAELQRATLRDMANEVMRWFTDDAGSNTLRTVLERVSLQEDRFDAVFLLQ